MYKIAVLSLAAMLTALTLWAVGAEPDPHDEAPTSAVIVLEPVHSRHGIGDAAAISIIDHDALRRLERFFPNYRKTPSSDEAGGWERGYRVYFNFSNGRALCVTVSENGGGDTWDMGNGDFATRGNFERFVKDLQSQSSRR